MLPVTRPPSGSPSYPQVLFPGPTMISPEARFSEEKHHSLICRLSSRRVRLKLPAPDSNLEIGVAPVSYLVSQILIYVVLAFALGVATPFIAYWIIQRLRAGKTNPEFLDDPSRGEEH